MTLHINIRININTNKNVLSGADSQVRMILADGMEQS